MNIRTCLFTFAFGALLAAGCGNEERVAECERGTRVAYGDGDWCVVVEEGFLTSDCPAEHPEGRAFGDAVVCGTSQAPDEMLTALVAAGFAESVCVDDAERGLVYVSREGSCEVEDVVCPEGDAAFHDACGCGCVYVGECTEGETRTVECNTCTCQDGQWLCTTLGCSTCEEGETRMEDCNTCTCEDGGWSCTEMACGECADGETRMEDCNTCTCEEGAWSCTEMACGECTEGETRTIECNTCVCSSGAWTCTGLACNECEEGETRVEGCESCTCSEGEWACSVDTFCAYESCVAECPASCDPSDEQLCGDDLTYHCTACHMACAGVSEVDASQCEDPASTCEAPLPPDAVPLEWSVYPAAGCDPMVYDFVEPEIFADEAAFVAAHPCADPSGIDWEQNRVARVVVMERTDAEVLAVWSRTEEVFVQTAAQAYCGGAAPPNLQLFALIPAQGPSAIRQGDCTYGRCTGPPAP